METFTQQPNSSNYLLKLAGNLSAYVDGAPGDNENSTAVPCPDNDPDCNMWFFKGEYRDLTQLTSVYTILIIIAIIIMALGMAGNAMVIGVVWSHRSMRTPTNYYIVSLAVSDLMVIIFVMPLKLVEYAADVKYSIFNTPLCSFTAFVFPMFVFTSIWTLVAISIDRYLVIIHPLKARSFNTRSRALRTIAIIWLAPFVLLCPYFYPYWTIRYYFESELGIIRRAVCTDRLANDFGHGFSMAFNLYLFGILFLLPVFLLGFTCGSIAKRLMSLTEDDKMLKGSGRKDDTSRRKVAKMVLVVVLCFFVCWCTFYIISILTLFTNILEQGNYIFIMLVNNIAGFANSCMNPVIYALMSQAFRSGFWEILTVCCPQYRDLVTPSGQRSERRSVTAVSQTEVVTDRVAQPKRGGYNRFFRRESTQFSAVSDQDEDRIGMSKLSKSEGNMNNNRKVIGNQIGQDVERKQRAERLLHKFLDEEPPKKTSGVQSASNDAHAVRPRHDRCETAFIVREDKQEVSQNGPKPIYRSSNPRPSNVNKDNDDSNLRLLNDAGGRRSCDARVTSSKDEPGDESERVVLMITIPDSEEFGHGDRDIPRIAVQPASGSLHTTEECESDRARTTTKALRNGTVNGEDTVDT